MWHVELFQLQELLVWHFERFDWQLLLVWHFEQVEPQLQMWYFFEQYYQQVFADQLDEFELLMVKQHNDLQLLVRKENDIKLYNYCNITMKKLFYDCYTLVMIGIHELSDTKVVAVRGWTSFFLLLRHFYVVCFLWKTICDITIRKIWQHRQFCNSEVVLVLD